MNAISNDVSLTARASTGDCAIADMALERADYDRERAVEELVKLIMDDEVYVKENFERIMSHWARSLIQNASCRQRKAVTREIKIVDRGVFSENLRDAMRNARIRMMDDPVYGGKRLGDCTIVEVRESASEYAKMARSHDARAKFHSAVAEEAARNAQAETDRIRDVLTEQTLLRIKEQTDA